MKNHLRKFVTRPANTALDSTTRNISSIIAAFITMAVTLFILGSVLLASLASTKAMNTLTESVRISVYLNADTHDNDQIVVNQTTKQAEENKSYQQIYKTLLKNKSVKTATFSSKDDELERLRKTTKAYEEIKDHENPLLDVYYVTFDKDTNVKKLITQLEKIDGVDSVKYGGEAIIRMITRLQQFKYVAYVIIAIFSGASIALIHNAIRASILKRSNDIEVMRLVGARDYHIQLPFIYESVYIAFIASFINMFALSILYTTIYNAIVKSGELTLHQPLHIVPILSAYLMIIGVGLAIFSSILAMRKYLKI